MAIFSNRVVLALVAVLPACRAASSPGLEAADFALRDGDTVVFLGDSITAARTYGKIVENYTLLRFPGRKVHFHNAGWGGDTAAGGLKRLERDVFAHGATRADRRLRRQRHRLGRRRPTRSTSRLYLDSIRGIVERVQGAQGPRLHLLGRDHGRGPGPERARLPPGDVRRGHGHRPRRWASAPSTSSAPCGRSSGTVLEGQRQSAKPQDKQTLHAADGVHLNDLGQLAMAFAILKGLGAPAEVSVGRSIDAAGPRVDRADGLPGDEPHGRREPARIRPARRRPADQLRPLRRPAVPLRADPRRAEPLHAHREEPARGPLRSDGRRPAARARSPADQLATGVNLASATADGWEPGGRGTPRRGSSRT